MYQFSIGALCQFASGGDIYPETLVLVADGEEIARHVRRFDRYLALYDWQHYIPLISQKPGALRNGAPFATMPGTLRSNERGDRLLRVQTV